MKCQNSYIMLQEDPHNNNKNFKVCNPMQFLKSKSTEYNGDITSEWTDIGLCYKVPGDSLSLNSLFTTRQYLGFENIF